jgi:hypothetical protein
MPTDVPNSFAAGRSVRNATVVFTRGLLDRLTDQELEAVLAHELTHIVNRDAFVMTIAAAPALLGRKVIWGFVSLPSTSESISGKIGTGFLVVYLLPLVFIGRVVYAFATLLVMSISRYREYVADRGAAVLSGAPEELMSALQKIADEVPLIPEQDLRTAAALNAFFVLPAQIETGDSELDPLRMFPTHPPRRGSWRGSRASPASWVAPAGVRRRRRLSRRRPKRSTTRKPSARSSSPHSSTAGSRGCSSAARRTQPPCPSGSSSWGRARPRSGSFSAPRALAGPPPVRAGWATR